MKSKKCKGNKIYFSAKIKSFFVEEKMIYFDKTN